PVQGVVPLGRTPLGRMIEPQTWPGAGLLSTDLLAFEQPWLQSLVAIAAVIFCAVAANWLARKIVLRLVHRALAIAPFAKDHPQLAGIVDRLSNIVPALVIQFGVGAVPHMPVAAVVLTRNVAGAF